MNSQMFTVDNIHIYRQEDLYKAAHDSRQRRLPVGAGGQGRLARTATSVTAASERFVALFRRMRTGTAALAGK